MTALTFTLRQSAHVGDDARGASVLGTLDHVPGAVVRGALAAAWITRNGEPRHLPGTQRAEFVALFEGGVRYGPLFAGTPPVPLSVLRHKYPARDDCDDAEHDEVRGEVGPRCPQCGSPWQQATRPEAPRESITRRTSVAITASGVAARGQIVTRDFLRPGLSFAGNLVADDPALLDTLRGLGPVRVGGRRTTHGLADVGIGPSSDPPLPERLPGNRIVLRLSSPAVFVDDDGLPSPEPNVADLQDVLGVRVAVRQRWSRWATVAGWHIASGLPKPTEIAVAAGSTYLLETAAEVTDDALRILTRRGVGLRRHEGFGDLGGPYRLQAGRKARHREAERLRDLVNQVAALRGIRTKQSLWPMVLDQLDAHAAGDPGATGFLKKMAADPLYRTALTRFLSFPPADARAVAQELRKGSS